MRSQDIPVSLAKQGIQSVCAFFQITTRQRALVLLFVSTFSFSAGISYGINQRYSALPEYSELEPTIEPTIEPTVKPTPDIPVKPIAKPPDVKLKIKAVGDIVPGTNYPNNRLHPQPKKLFQAVKSTLQGADFLFGNFESTLTNYPFSAKRIGGLVIAFRTPPSYTQFLKDAGFDVMSVANNHSYDFAAKGFSDTMQNLEKVGIKALGKKGQILLANHKGLTVAWIGFSSFDQHNSVNKLKESIALVKEASKNANMVVISFHAGAEGTGAMHVKNRTEYFHGENRGNLVQFSRAMIDNGADLILGHGPHVPRAMELYKGKLVAYSLGNFMGYRTLSSQAQLGYSLVLEVELNNRGDFVSGKIIPIHLNRQGIPDRDRYGRSIKLIRELTQKDFPKTPLTIDNKGQILRKPAR